MAKRRVVIEDITGGLVENPKEPTDTPRYLRQKAGYTSLKHQAVPGEPEPVPEGEQTRQTKAAREKRERVVMSPLYDIDHKLGKLEEAGHYKPSKVRFIRKLLRALGEDAMRSAVE